MASAFYLGKRFTIDPARLEAALTGAEAHFTHYRELSQEEQHLRQERQQLSAKIRQNIEVGRLSENVMDADGKRALREPMSEEIRAYKVDAEIAKLVTRKAAAAAAAQAHGRIAEAAQEHARTAGGRARPLTADTLGYIR